MLSIATMTEERIAASGTAALAPGRPMAMASTVQLTAYGSGDVCAFAIRNAHDVSPADKAWAVRPLIPDGSGGG